jgi:hypothetical protein
MGRLTLSLQDPFRLISTWTVLEIIFWIAESVCDWTVGWVAKELVTFISSLRLMTRKRDLF